MAKRNHEMAIGPNSDIILPSTKRVKVLDEEREKQIEVMRPFSFRELVEEFNRKVWRDRVLKKKKMVAFVCHDCGCLCLYRPNRLTNNEGDNGYCDDCVMECPGCLDLYTRDEQVFHDDCIVLEEDEWDDKGNY